ncbi:MAG: TonB-dependent receptor [Dysgonamonadaceae bacterium]|jgi:TonB-linked SusC/RagA family outer membrane protein|nr:TonB-dependent receptor [Dysgonamonadaceae bacterium]
MALLLIAAIAMPVEVFAQQSRTLTGVVLDENTEPVIGANVTVPGTSVGTTTDLDGKFQLPVPAGKTTIQVAYLGYQTQTISIANQAAITIQLVPENQGLDEVIVIGYGMVKKRDLTGAVSSVKNTEIAMAPVTNILEAMQGRVAGLDIVRKDGRVNADSRILLRGNRSLYNTDDTNANEPIYIIDGIQGNINHLNANDIASIDILKDASSTAIYGSAGANGVIMITTKKAEKGKIQVDFNSYLGVNTNPRYPRALQGDAWIRYLQEGYRSTYPTAATPGYDALFTAYNLRPDLTIPYLESEKWVDWVDETLRTGVQQNYAISLRGGSERVRGQFSLGYNKNQGVYLNDDAQRYTLRTGVVTDISKYLTAGIETGLIWQDGNSRSSRVNRAFGTLPLGDVRDENGTITQYPIEGWSDVNPIVDNVPGAYANNQKSINLTANPYIELNLFKGFSFKSILGTSISSSRTGTFNSDHTFMSLTGSSAQIKNGTYATVLSYNYTWENILNYSTVIADDHNLSATALTSWKKNQRENASAYSEDFLYDDFLWYSLSSGVRPSVSSSYRGSAMMSYAGRINYAYKGKYLFNASLRVDGASQLAHHWDQFPGVSAAWRISDESFMENTQSWLSNLKLRLGYGVSGNSNIDPYSSKTEVTSTGLDAINLGGGQLLTSVLTETVGNEALGWEKSYNMNLGLDFGLFKNRVDATVELYDTDTKGVLYQRSLPFSGGGFTAKTAYKMTGNLAQMHNQGIEITINTRNIDTKEFKWNSTLTFAANKEQVKGIDLGSGMTVDDLKDLNLFIGHPLRTVFGIQKLGIWQTNEAADAAVFGLLPGDVKVQSNLTKVRDGVWADYTQEEPVEYTADKPYTVGANDRIIYGQRDPKWTAGFQNSFYYKNFDLNIFATARWGHLTSASLLSYFGRIAMPDTYDYWTPENPTNDFPRYYLQRGTTQYTQPIQSLGTVDGSYVKIKNITLGYQLPQKLNKKLGLSVLRLYGTLYNPFIFTKSHLLKDIDPEAGSSDSFPLYRQMVFGVNITF